MAHSWLLKKFAREQEDDVFIKTRPPRKMSKDEWSANLQHIHLEDIKLIEEQNITIKALQNDIRSLQQDYNNYMNTNAIANELDDAKREISSLKRYIRGLKETVLDFAETLDEAVDEA